MVVITDGIEAIIQIISGSIDLSVSGTVVLGNENFRSSKDYAGPFDTYEYNGLFGKASISWSSCCQTLSIGKKFSTGRPYAWGITRSKSQYVLLSI